jgi:drug/metabolite transporter (DMT)-like permease
MNKPSLLLGFVLLVAIDSFVQIALKFTSEHALPITFDLAWLQRIVMEPWLLAVVLGAGSAFLTYMTLIRYAAIGPAFAASHLDIVAVTLFSVYVLGDTLTPLQIAGCSCIVLGVLVLACTETASP